MVNIYRLKRFFRESFYIMFMSYSDFIQILIRITIKAIRIHHMKFEHNYVAIGHFSLDTKSKVLVLWRY